MSYEVALIDVDHSGSITNAVEQAIELSGGFIPENNSLIAIKPNLTTDKNPPESGMTTHVAVVEAVINHVNKTAKGCKIIVIETDSDGTIKDAFRRLGYEELASRYSNVDLVDLAKHEVVKLITPDNEKIRAIEVPEILFSIDYFITVANLKRHVHERMSGIWKNAWGIPSHKSVRMRLHPFLPEALFIMNTTFQPDLSIIDAIIGLQGAGPLEGQPKYVGKILCGKDPLAVDMVGARLMGEKPSGIPALRYAMKRLQRKNNDVSVVGCKLEPVEFNFVPWTSYLLYRLSMRTRRAALYLENLGLFLSIVGFGLRIDKITGFAGGGTQSLKTTLIMAKDLILRQEVADRTIG
ncbi:MAG: DUF362 domain-containing protein [Chloroflexota bacterium]|nr:DUF362 domain-containing protein [Chloroflexota bacterium]